MIDFLFLAPMFLIGAIAVYTDIKQNRIPNKLIVAGLICAVVLYASVLIYDRFFIGLQTNLDYMIEALLNTAAAMIAGYVIWDLKLWSPGDAKLFMVYAALLPLKFYSASFVRFFPSINLLINLFVPLVITIVLKAGFVYAGDFLAKRNAAPIVETAASKEEKRKTRIFRLKNFGYSLAMFFTVFVFFQIVSGLFSGTILASLFGHPLFAFCFMIIVSGKLMNILNKNQWSKRLTILFPLLYMIYRVLLGQWQFVLGSARMVVIMWFIFNVFKQAIAFYVQTREISVVPLDCLKKGDMPCPSAEIIIKSKLSVVGRVDDLGSWGPEGLSLEQVTLISSIPVEERKTDVEIYKTFSFAPYMLFSAVLCILTRSSFMALLVNWIG
ncbi:MAG TPA: prepilin peptidase [Candidatus Colwellbacteria bacterium]|nr:prepilin peptidase [Candidatus Colwellbacteria bacterium]